MRVRLRTRLKLWLIRKQTERICSNGIRMAQRLPPDERQEYEDDFRRIMRIQRIQTDWRTIGNHE